MMTNNKRPDIPMMRSSASGTQFGLVMLYVESISVDRADACIKCGYCWPADVDTSGTSPSAVKPMITVLCSRSGNSSLPYSYDVNCFEKSIHIEPLLSVTTGSNGGIRKFSTPVSSIFAV